MSEGREELIRNTVDFHLHASPDPNRERTADAHEVALKSREAGMKGVVLKAHAYSTAPLAQVIRKLVPGIEVIGSLVLNYEAGGINPEAVEAAAKMGARVIWMPTTSAPADRRRRGYQDGITVTGEDGKILSAVKDVLSLVKRYDLALCTGHLAQEEVISLFREAKKMGVKKFVLTHPLKVADGCLDLDVQKTLAGEGAFIEHCFLATAPDSGNIPLIRVVEAIRFVGLEHCLLSTDFGKTHRPPPWEGMGDMLAAFSRSGLTRPELSVLAQDNPARLLDI